MNNKRSTHAELIGSDTCSAGGVTVQGSAPVLVMCRQLLAQGLSLDAALAVYRGATLALRVHAFGEAAKLEVKSHGTDFRAPPCKAPDPAHAFPGPGRHLPMGGHSQMSAVETYQACTIKRSRRTAAEIDEIKSAMVAVLRADHPMTVRKVFYQLVVRGAIEKIAEESERALLERWADAVESSNGKAAP
jgi:hypothetical protein